ncbi:MAG TPA: hypothetical protein VMF35_02135, partial [Acidimicrobiales bacterium]|nr:hypothetical protein [Acidimicrobiales bacterium]
PPEPLPPEPLPVEPLPVEPLPLETVVAVPAPVPAPVGVPDAVTELPVVALPAAGELTAGTWFADALGADEADDSPVLAAEPVGPDTHALVGALLDAAGFADARKAPNRRPPSPNRPITKNRPNSVNIFVLLFVRLTWFVPWV